MNDNGPILSGVLSRRSLLRMTAGVAGATALPGILNSAAAAAPVAGIMPVAGAPDLLTDEVFPIGFFWPPPARMTTDVKYDEIAQAGINLVLGGNDVYNWERNVPLLEVAERHGLRVLAVDQRISNAVPTPGWRDRIRAVADQYLQYSAFAGFRIADEPSPTEYPRFRMITDVLAEAAPTKLSHINLVPVYETHLADEYTTFLDRYVDQSATTFISFDHYPLLTDGSTRASFFLNHALVRAAGLNANLPTWVYIQAVDHWNLKRPNYAELAWQINMGLAYGCKGIKYFTYWTPENRPDFEFGQALIKKDGCQSQVYVDAQDINRGHLQPVGAQLKHLASKKVFHANENPLPAGAVGFAAAESRVLSGVAGRIVLGEFERSTDDGMTWVLAVNRSFTANVNFTLTVKPDVSAVSGFDPARGAYDPVPLNASRAFTASLAPGRARLYQLTRTTTQR